MNFNKQSSTPQVEPVQQTPERVMSVTALGHETQYSLIQQLNSVVRTSAMTYQQECDVYDIISHGFNSKPLIYSKFTYSGMPAALDILAQNLIQDGKNPHDVFVLCPVYRETPGSNWGPGGDTQAGCGGKVAYGETPIEAAIEECAEELRINLPETAEHVSSTRKCNIFSASVNQCSAIQGFDPRVYGRKDRRGSDTNNKSACIVYGNFAECVKLLNNIPHTPDGCTTLVDNIKAIALVSVSQCILMATYAMNEMEKWCQQHQRNTNTKTHYSSRNFKHFKGNAGNLK